LTPVLLRPISRKNGILKRLDYETKSTRGT